MMTVHMIHGNGIVSVSGRSRWCRGGEQQRHTNVARGVLTLSALVTRKFKLQLRSYRSKARPPIRTIRMALLKDRALLSRRLFARATLTRGAS